MTALKRVLVFGGTHGNEWTGIMAVQQYAHLLRQEFPELDLHFIHANPEAYLLKRRFKDEDLNRAFQYVNEQRPQSYENGRARELKALILKEPCFVIDLHTTTSNMGNTVIISHGSPYNFSIAKNLAAHLPTTKIILSSDTSRKYLASQSDFGMMVEVGPVANNLIDAAALEETIEIIRVILRSVALNEVSAGPLEIYEEVEDVYYPLDENGAISSYIHRNFQGKDFIPVKGPFKAFKSFEGKDIEALAREELYPIFINEAAYYPSKLAFTFCKKRLLNF